MFKIYVKISNFDDISAFGILAVLYAQMILSILQIIIFDVWYFDIDIESDSYNSPKFGTGIAELLVSETDSLSFLMTSFDWEQ